MSPIPPIPTATYRVQFGPGFGFRDAERIVPYLHRLGVSHVYASPILKARPGSAHGYDIIDHTALNDELGDAADFDAFVDALRRHGMGLILDFVPNHMGVARADNGWWLDVLEWGEASPFAGYFDIDWRPPKAELRGKVLLPFLGAHYGVVLRQGELVLRFDAEAGTFSVWYHDHRFPVAPHYYARILAADLEPLRAAQSPALAAVEALIVEFRAIRASGRATGGTLAGRAAADGLKAQLRDACAADPVMRDHVERCLARINGRPGDAGSFRALHRLLELQHYRLAYWRVAADEINYRRFFDVNELAALSMERPELFEVAHRLILHLIAEGKVQGLRIDHIDGLYDPGDYLRKLTEAAAAAAPEPTYLVVEKILEVDEALPADWPVAGTTGYDFLALLDGVFVDPTGEPGIDRAYRRQTGIEAPFDDVAYASKKRILETALAGELTVLAGALDRISESNLLSRDFTYPALADALKEVIAAFPVYRTYIADQGPVPAERAHIDAALAAARARRPDIDAEIFDFVHAVLTTDLVRGTRRGYRRGAVIRFAMRFQQLTGPVMAKSIEDTSFYRYNRLVALNEVGNDPRRFGISPEAFDRANAERLARYPHAMLASTTHDTKRSEDVRARLVALSGLAESWDAAVQAWAVQNRGLKTIVDGEPAPSRNDEYLLYQTLLGAWPLDDGAGPDDFRARISAYMLKALREAKVRTSWVQPNPAYEAAVEDFVERILDPALPGAFRRLYLPFQARLARLGMLNALAATVLKLTVPGVPDIYQGCELWALTLVDPDNRRPVDFAARERLLDGLRCAAAGDRAALAADLVEGWRDGRIKLFVTATLLALRRAAPALFGEGSYEPLAAAGPRADRVLAFMRRHRGDAVVVAVPRLLANPPAGDAFWAGTSVVLPEPLPGPPLADAFTGAPVEAADAIPAATLFAGFPVAVLTRPAARS